MSKEKIQELQKRLIEETNKIIIKEVDNYLQEVCGCSFKNIFGERETGGTIGTGKPELYHFTGTTINPLSAGMLVGHDGPELHSIPKNIKEGKIVSYDIVIPNAQSFNYEKTYKEMKDTLKNGFRQEPPEDI